jgi:hypothetical protein
VNVPADEVEFPEALVEADVGDDVGLVPVVRVQPALGDHALGGEIDDVVRAEFLRLHGGDAVGVVIEVELLEAEPG